MRQPAKLSVAALQICTLLVDDPTARVWAYELAKRLDLSPRAVASILSGRENAGWMASEWERPERVGLRPRRRLYRLTDLGRKRTGETLACLTVRTS